MVDFAKLDSDSAPGEFVLTMVDLCAAVRKDWKPIPIKLNYQKIALADCFCASSSPLVVMLGEFT